jgi:hypothetical protein
VLFGSSKAHKRIRELLVEEQKLDAIISLPGGVFKPYAGVSTAILVFTRTDSGGTDHVWFYDMEADGWSLDDKRQPLLPEEKLGPHVAHNFSVQSDSPTPPRLSSQKRDPQGAVSSSIPATSRPQPGGAGLQPATGVWTFFEVKQRRRVRAISSRLGTRRTQ